MTPSTDPVTPKCPLPEVENIRERFTTLKAKPSD